MPYLLARYASALSVFPQFRAGLYDGEDVSGRTVLSVAVDGDDDDQHLNDVWTPLGLGETDVNVQGLSLKV